MSISADSIPGYVAGTWDVDATHSNIEFTVKHMMVSKVRGKFTNFSGVFTTAENPEESTVEAEVDMTSIETGNADRDAHVKSPDFFESDTWPHMTFRSTALRSVGSDFELDGDLTIKDVTRPVTFKLELTGFGPDAYGGTRAGFSARTQINRTDFNVQFNGLIEATGGAVVSDKVGIELEVEGVLRT